MNDLYGDPPTLDTPLARHSDPDTSHEAADLIKPSLNRLRAWAVSCVLATPGLTARELSERHCPGDPKRIDRRLGECERLGTVRRGEPRACTVGGRRAATWWPITPKLG